MDIWTAPTRITFVYILWSKLWLTLCLLQLPSLMCPLMATSRIAT